MLCFLLCCSVFWVMVNLDDEVDPRDDEHTDASSGLTLCLFPVNCGAFLSFSFSFSFSFLES